jgi:hypothetical protein
VDEELIMGLPGEVTNISTDSASIIKLIHLILEIPSFVRFLGSVGLDFGKFVQNPFLDVVHELVLGFLRLPDLTRLNFGLRLVAKSKGFASTLPYILIVIIG